MDEARLSELERRIRGPMAFAGFTRMHDGDRALDELIATAREALTLRRLIEEHNAKLVARCERQTGYCTHDPARCIACPQRDVIPLPWSETTAPRLVITSTTASAINSSLVAPLNIARALNAC